MTTPQEYAKTHAETFKNQLIEILKMPSISTLSDHAPDVRRVAEWLVADMQRFGMEARLIEHPSQLPLVYGEWMGAGDDAPTVLVYCHFDVQPAEMRDGWLTQPFEPTEKDGKIYARGAVDSKSHVIAQLKAIESQLATDGKLPCNVKVLFEGEEESGSEHIFEYVAQHADLLKADAIVISDGSHPDIEQPILDYGLRGITTFEVHVTGPKRDLHSGHYGGNVHNPIQALAEIIAKLHDDNGTVTVPGFYDDIPEYTEEERQILAPVKKWAEEEWYLLTGAPQPWGEKEFEIHERISVRPTLEINGIEGGFYGEGFKTVLPSKAMAKISCRLVPYQDPQRIFEQVRDYIQQIAPPTVTVEVISLEMGAPGIVFDRNSAAVRAASVAYEKGWGRKPIYYRAGGSIPIAANFAQHLDGQITVMPFGYKGGGAHGPNEYVIVEMFNKGVQTAIHFYHEFATLHQGAR